MNSPLIVAGANVLGALARSAATVPPTSPELVVKIEEFERELAGGEPVDVPTEHLIHGGMYARTVIVPAGMFFTNVLVKRATVVIVVGSLGMNSGDKWLELEGYNVLPASAGRKQVFVSRTPVIITMVFPTMARTVAEAEAEFTDQAEKLLSRRQDTNRAVITEGSLCLE